MVVQTLGEVPPELRITAEQDERLAEQARRVGGADVVRLLELLADGMRAMKDGADARTQLELALVKAATPARDASTVALQARLERLEARLAGSVAPAAPAPAPHSPSEPATAAGRAGRATVAATAPPSPSPSPPPAAAPEADHEEPRTVTAVAVVEPGSAEDEPGFTAAVELSLEAFRGVWPAVLDALAGESPMLAAVLRDARPAVLADQGLTLAWPESAAFSKRQAEEPAKKELIAHAIRAVTGASLKLAHELRADHDDIVSAASSTTAEPQLSESELVARFMAEFDAEELPPEEPPSPPQETQEP
jgi:DNA polymerase-3 subunit gamma/tau